jgi:tetratricopeptide (TPR) repeat protein
MPKFGKAAMLPAIAATLLASGLQTAAAQQVKDCDIDESNGGVAMAYLALTAAQQQGIAPDAQNKKLAEALGRLFPGDPKTEEANNAKNAAGRAFTLGKIYMIYLSQDGFPVVTTRGRLGFKTNPEGAADLAVGIDSAFKVVEEKLPQCATLTSQWRQQAGWVKLVQQATDLVNNNKIDSAELIAHKALLISPTTPYSHLILGNVAAQRQKNMEAVQHYKAALAEAEKDTIFAEVRRNILYTLGGFAAEAASMDTVPATRKAMYQEALNAFTDLKKDPGKTYKTVAKQGRTQVLMSMADTSAIVSECKPMVDNPSGQDFDDVIQCGVMLASVNDNAASTKLFEAAAALNPFHRDALFNLARQQLAIGQYQQGIASIDKLMAVDPSNPDNLRLYTYAYGNLRRHYVALADTVGKAANALPRTAANTAKRKALTDSAIKLDSLQKAVLAKQLESNNKADAMQVQVLFGEFTPLPEKATLAGEIRNKSDAEKSYTLDVEFLDKSGNVVTTGQATVPKVAPHNVGKFTITATGANIAAFRYKPIQ